MPKFFDAPSAKPAALSPVTAAKYLAISRRAVYVFIANRMIANAPQVQS